MKELGCLLKKPFSRGRFLYEEERNGEQEMPLFDQTDIFFFFFSFFFFFGCHQSRVFNDRLPGGRALIWVQSRMNGPHEKLFIPSRGCG